MYPMHDGCKLLDRMLVMVQGVHMCVLGGGEDNLEQLGRHHGKGFCTQVLYLFDLL